MNVHKNAVLTPRGREQLTNRIEGRAAPQESDLRTAPLRPMLPLGGGLRPTSAVLPRRGTLRGKGETTPRARSESVWECALVRACREVRAIGTDLGLRTVTKQKHFKRRVRERMQKTGESYTTARLHLLETFPAPPKDVPPVRGEPARIRFKGRRLAGRTRGPLGLRYMAPACGIVISLAVGVAGFLTLTAEYTAGESSAYVTEQRP